MFVGDQQFRQVHATTQSQRRTIPHHRRVNMLLERNNVNRMRNKFYTPNSLGPIQRQKQLQDHPKVNSNNQRTALATRTRRDSRTVGQLAGHRLHKSASVRTKERAHSVSVGSSQQQKSNRESQSRK